MNDLPEESSDQMQPPAPHAEEKFRELLALVARLRSPGGCPWDQSRRPEDISRYLLEESYEVVEAIEPEFPENYTYVGGMKPRIL